MGTIVISCPACQKQSKAPAEVQGKKIRCKACGEVFAVKATPPAAAAPAKKSAPPKGDLVEAEAPAPRAADDDEEEGSNPYAVTDLDTGVRCPHCAAAMPNAEAIVCLECGYNTNTRSRVVSTTVYENTGGDYFMWLLPGIACALTVLLLLGAIAYLWIGGRAWKETGEDAGWWNRLVLAGQVWGTIMSLFFIYLSGKFAVKRLIFNPHPPEVEKKK